MRCFSRALSSQKRKRIDTRKKETAVKVKHDHHRSSGVGNHSSFFLLEASVQNIACPVTGNGLILSSHPPTGSSDCYFHLITGLAATLHSGFPVIVSKLLQLAQPSKQQDRWVLAGRHQQDCRSAAAHISIDRRESENRGEEGEIVFSNYCLSLSLLQRKMTEFAFCF